MSASKGFLSLPFLRMIRDGSQHFGMNLELRDGVREARASIFGGERKKTLHPARWHVVPQACELARLSGPIEALDSINHSSSTAEQRK